MYCIEVYVCIYVRTVHTYVSLRSTVTAVAFNFWSLFEGELRPSYSLLPSCENREEGGKGVKLCILLHEHLSLFDSIERVTPTVRVYLRVYLTCVPYMCTFHAVNKSPAYQMLYEELMDEKFAPTLEVKHVRRYVPMCVCTCTYSTYLCVYIHTCTYLCVYIRTCTYSTYLCVYIHVCMNVISYSGSSVHT